MAAEYHYRTRDGTDTTLSSVRFGRLGLIEEAEIGAVATSGIYIDDVDASLDIIGNQEFYVNETDAPGLVTLSGTVAKTSGSLVVTGSGTSFLSEVDEGREIVIGGGGGTDYLFVDTVDSDTHITLWIAPSHTASGQTGHLAPMQRIFTGLTGDQAISRYKDQVGGGMVLGPGRTWSVDIVDLNTILHFRIEHGNDANRGAETLGTRLAWLLSTDELTNIGLVDEGMVQYPSTALDKADLRHRFVDEIFNDFSQVSGYSHDVYLHEYTGHYALWFNKDKPFMYPSSLRLSNRKANILADSSIQPTWDNSLLKRSVRRVVSGVDVVYARGTTYRTNAATALLFGKRDGNAPNANRKTLAKAQAYGDRFLTDNSTQDERGQVTWTALAEDVNKAKPNQQIRIEQQHWTGAWSAERWARIVRREVTQTKPGVYDIKADLIPVSAQPGSIVQTSVRSTAPGGGVSSFPANVTIGSLLVYMGCKRGPASPGPGPIAPNTNIANPRWGAGAWTDATPNGGAVRVAWDDPRAYEEGMRLYWKIADSTSADCYVDEYTVGTCWEIAGATMAGATIVYETLQTFSNTHAIGSLGSPSAGQIALIMLALGPGAADPVSPLVALNPGVWVRDIHADGYAHVWSSNNNSIGFNQPAPPETWIGHTIADGSALAATITDTYPHKWGGIALVLA